MGFVMKKEDVSTRNLKKHIAAIRVSNEVGLLARKAWNVLLLNAYDDLLSEERHCIPMSVFRDVTGYDSRSYSSLITALRKLQTTLVTWDIGGGAEIQGAWLPNFRSYQMLGTFEIKDGELGYYYPKKLPELLYEPAIYQKIDLSQQKEFKTAGGLALWENCIRFIGVGTTGLSDVDEWREILGVSGKKTYSQFFQFNAKVLKPAIKEVNEFTNISVEMFTKNRGRKVIQLGFTVKEKEQRSLFSDRLEVIHSAPEYEELLSFGIHKVQAIKWIEEHGLPYIRQKLDILKEIQAQKELKNPSGFLVKAINENYQSANAVAKAKEAERKKKELAAKRRKEAEEKLQSEYEKYKKQTTENFWDVFPPSVKNIMLKDFETKLDDMALQAYKKYGLESAMVLSNFRIFLREEHMQNGEILSFQDWKKKQKTKA